MPFRRTIESEIQVDGRRLCWRVRREPQWCTADGWKGLSIAVELDGSHRQLFLEYPFRINSHFSTPHRQRPKISEKVLERHVRLAIAAGWTPEERGKPFVFQVPDRD